MAATLPGNLINVATNGLWRCRLRPVTFYIIKYKKKEPNQVKIHVHTYICTFKKENYKIYAHWPQRVPKRVPSRHCKGSDGGSGNGVGSDR